MTGTDYTPTTLAQVSINRSVPNASEGLSNLFDNNTSTKLYLGKNAFKSSTE
ncbi:MAG: hypothetical protein QM756_10995 [Polyangiaceae bacterium]